MKRKIIVTINADEKTCGKCDALFGDECGRFYDDAGGTFLNKDLRVDRYGKALRCAACLAAERKAKEAGR